MLLGDVSSFCSICSILVLLLILFLTSQYCRRPLYSVITTMFRILSSAYVILTVELRLQRCGIKKLVYLIEGDPNLTDAAEPLKTA